MSEGLVVASWGWNFSIASISPVSATTTVYLRNCSNKLCGIIPPGDDPHLLGCSDAHSVSVYTWNVAMLVEGVNCPVGCSNRKNPGDLCPGLLPDGRQRRFGRGVGMPD